MSKFQIIYNLEGLSEKEREQYKRDVSVFFGLDPDTNWFDILWIADETTGLKKLQLYARRGTTDVLRSQRGINILSMSQHDGPGYVSFTAVGQDKNGRQEIAVGAHSIEGLKGEKLAAAISTAETRAGRRLTLKFCGLGILDYSEINQDVPLSATASNVELVSSIPPAMTVAPLPSSLPMPTIAPAKINDAVAQCLAEADEIARQAKFQLEQQQLRDEAKAQLDAKPNAPSEIVEFNGLKTDGPIPQSPTTEITSEMPLVRKRGPRKKKNTVDIASPGQEISAPEPVSPIAEIAQKSETPQVPVPKLAVKQAESPYPPVGIASNIPSASVAGNSVVPTQAFDAGGPPNVHQPILAPPAPTAPADFPGKPTKEQEDGYRAILREYANNVLPNAGMRPSQDIGGPSAKLRKFAEYMSGKPTQQMTTTDWDDFLGFFPGFLKDNNPKNLVKYIDDCLGAK